MTLYLPAQVPTPDFWRVFGHSWFQYQTGPSGDQTGRVDAMFRGHLDVEQSNWRNYAVNGAKATGSNRSTGGWSRFMQRIQPPSGRAFPYAADGGGTIICYGINDLGVYGGQTTAVQNTYIDAMRAVISRARAARQYPTTDSAWAFGTGFANNASGLDLGMSTVDRLASSTTSATATFTLPSDYKGEAVAFGFIKRPDVTGGTITFSGTAGVTGTYSTSSGGGGIPSAFLNNSYQVKRVTTLTSSNAGQTIILTVTALDASGNIFLDGAWLESLTPPPVLVCNIARLTLAGYYNSAYNQWSTTGTRAEATMDGEVNTVNGLLATMVAEFDAMVQIADVDTAIAKNSLYTSDGIHPNEWGAGRVVDALVDAKNRLRPPATAFGISASFNPPGPRAGNAFKPRVAQWWHTADDASSASATYAMPASGTLIAIPFLITEARDQYTQIGVDVATAGTVSPVIRWGIYDDVDRSGYPGELTPYDPTGTTGFTLALSTGLKSQNLLFPWPPDPGLYWLAMKTDTQGTGEVLRGITPTQPSMFLPNRPSGGAGVGVLNVGWQVTGAGTGALPGSFPVISGATLIQTAPALSLFKNK